MLQQKRGGVGERIVGRKMNREREKRNIREASLHISNLYMAKNWEMHSGSGSDRKKKGTRVFAIPLRYFRAALGSDSSKNTWTRVSRAPESRNLASSSSQPNPRLLFLFCRASSPPSFHASIGSRKNTGTCYGQHVPPLPKNSPLGM